MVDARIEWVKEKALKLMDETNGELFDEALSEGDGHLWDQMISFLVDKTSGPHDVTTRLFFLYKTYYEKIVHEEVLMPELGKIYEVRQLFIDLISVWNPCHYRMCRGQKISG
jgi:hypothetical protein